MQLPQHAAVEVSLLARVYRSRRQVMADCLSAGRRQRREQFSEPEEALATTRQVPSVVVIGGILWWLSQPQTGAQIANVIRAVSPAPSIAPPASATPKIGDVLQLGNWRYRVLEAGSSQGMQFGSIVIRPKGVFVVVKLELTNIGNRNFTLNT